jgi:hypothetical protein
VTQSRARGTRRSRARIFAAVAACAAVASGPAAARAPAPQTVAENTPPVHAAQAVTPPWRGMRNGAFVSTADPEITVRVVPELRYIGKTEFDLKETAHVERYHFVATNGNRITRMLVLQFEQMLPDTDEIYRWSVKRPQTLGENVYHFSTFVFSVAKAAESKPEAEIGRTVELLKQKNLELEDEQAVARFARVVGEDRRHEFIIFYDEPLAAMSRRLDEVVSGDEDFSPAFENLAGALTARAQASFSVIDAAK